MAGIWPSMTDYSAAVQDPEASFRVPELARAEFATMPPLGLPAIASGQNAVVFRARTEGRTTAVRCFTTECSHGRRRYRALERHLASRPVPAMAAASWVDAAVAIGGESWPVVTMEWIEGVSLHDYVATRLDDPLALLDLAEDWIGVCRSLKAAGVAHGDLQHGNVMVDTGGRIRLIDFDGVWLPEVASLPPSETGHPNFQHPARAESRAWSWSIDWFSALVVLISLRALAADAFLWDRHNGENLIFTAADFRGDTEVWSALERCDDPTVRRLSAHLAEGCAHLPDAPYDLETIVERGLVGVEPPEGIGSGTEPGRVMGIDPQGPVRPPTRTPRPSRDVSSKRGLQTKSSELFPDSVETEREVIENRSPAPQMQPSRPRRHAPGLPPASGPLAGSPGPPSGLGLSRAAKAARGSTDRSPSGQMARVLAALIPALIAVLVVAAVLMLI